MGCLSENHRNIKPKRDWIKISKDQVIVVMRLSVKIVGGSECECEASPDSSVESLKRDVEVKLQLGKETEQKLLFRGKALQGKN